MNKAAEEARCIEPQTTVSEKQLVSFLRQFRRPPPRGVGTKDFGNLLNISLAEVNQGGFSQSVLLINTRLESGSSLHKLSSEPAGKMGSHLATMVFHYMEKSRIVKHTGLTCTEVVRLRDVLVQESAPDNGLAKALVHVLSNYFFPFGPMGYTELAG